ncbi:MAG: DUF3380 domain-containing protein [Alphaproteobacteria bacterium]|nr:DUF3380 domain-containing protein [Alphaproteobacteria bacterium]
MLEREHRQPTPSTGGPIGPSADSPDHTQAVRDAAGGQLDASTMAGLSDGLGNAAVAELLAAQQQTYTVQSGDTLSKIARAVLGDSSRYMEIFEANADQLSSPNAIRVGQVLRIPSSAPAVEEQPTEQAPVEQPAVEQPAVEQPVETAPVEQAPVETAPVETAPVETTPEVTEEPAAPEGTTYTVQAGDTLGRIAAQVLGDSRRYMEIFEANADQLSSPNAISIGQVLRIPAQQPVVSETPPEQTTETTTETTEQQTTEQQTETGNQEPTEETQEQTTVAEGHAITDNFALVRTDPPELASTETVIPVGTIVEIVEETTKNGREYVKVSEPAQGEGEEATVWGWTSKANLGSAKEFDTSLEHDDQIPLQGLRGLERKMAVIHNTKGGFLEEQSNALGIDVAAAAGTLQVESRGAGFSNDGRQIIRFENHVFYDQWGNRNRDTFNEHFQYSSGQRWKGHKWRRNATDAWQTFHGNQDSEYEVLEFARSLDDTGALKSISMGAAQIMGFNHESQGFDTVQEMFESFDTGIKPQLEGLFTYIEGNNTCLTGLRNGDYVQFARGYNGSGQAETYGGLIEDAAAAYRRVLANHRARQQNTES